MFGLLYILSGATLFFSSSKQVKIATKQIKQKFKLFCSIVLPPLFNNYRLHKYELIFIFFSLFCFAQALYPIHLTMSGLLLTKYPFQILEAVFGI